ncbi:MAG: N-acetylneuraminate synthase [Phycisphaerae bacterium]|nr:N-acetylneuraminate synthase [Phycisphaerae bacterium]
MRHERPEVRVGSRRITTSEPPFLIAEIGVNHDGEIERAIELVRAAADAGADAVKFQWFEAERLVGDAAATAGYQRRAGVSDQKAMLAALELGREELALVVDAAHESGIAAMVTVFSTELVESARTLDWDAWKTASPDLVHRPLLEALAADGRPLFVSTGASDLQEVARTDEWFPSTPLAFLHCVSAYPTPEDRADLGAMAEIARMTARPCGYSDHTALETTGGLAVAAGACVLEKHLTWSSAAAGPDHAASIEPEGFARYASFVRRAHAALGDGVKVVGDLERDVRAVARQSVRAASNLEAGTVISDLDLVVKRPGDGIEPWRLTEIIGRRLRRGLRADQPIREDDLIVEKNR